MVNDCSREGILFQSIRVFFLIRGLFYELTSIVENDLPLTKTESLFKENDTLDLRESEIGFVSDDATASFSCR